MRPFVLEKRRVNVKSTKENHEIELRKERVKLFVQVRREEEVDVREGPVKGISGRLHTDHLMRWPTHRCS